MAQGPVTQAKVDDSPVPDSWTITRRKDFLETYCQGYIFYLVKTGLEEICVLENEACATQKFPPLLPED